MADTIGFIGLGSMGSGMARRLLGAGHRLLACDLREDRVAAMVASGATGSADAGDVARRCDILLTSLPTPAAFTSVAEQHILPQARAGQIVIDLGTSLVADTRRLAAALAVGGATLVDAPVSGGAKGAAAGNLRVFVGGPRDAFDRIRPLLEAIGDRDRIVYFGPSGAGQLAKAVNQLAMGLGAAAYVEAIHFGVRQNLDPKLLDQAVGGSGGWRMHFSEIAQAIAGGRGETIQVKDSELGHFLEEAAAEGIPLPMAGAVHLFCEGGEKTVPESSRLAASYWRELNRSGPVSPEERG